MSETRKRSAVPWIAGVVLVLVLYVGSAGPTVAVLLHTSGPEIPRWYKIVYAPLIWACKHSETANGLLWRCVFVFSRLFYNDVPGI